MPTIFPNQTGGIYYGTSVWDTWVQTGTTNVSTSSWIESNSWIEWQTSPTQFIQTGTMATTVWANWQTNPSGLQLYAAPPPVVPDPRADLVRKQRSRSADLRRKVAGRRAENLLLENLTAEQREEWAAGRAFTVLTAGGKRAYKISYGLAGNVRLVRADEAPIGKRGLPLQVGARFCAHVYHPEGLIPNEDNVLAQKLLIESNEEEFLAMANVS